MRLAPRLLVQPCLRTHHGLACVRVQFNIEPEVEPTDKQVVRPAAPPAVHGRAVLAFHPNIYGAYAWTCGERGCS